MKKWYPFNVQISTAGFVTTIGSEIWVNSDNSESAMIFMSNMVMNEILKRGEDRCTVSINRIDSFDIQESLDDLKEMRSEYWVDDALNKRRW